MDQYFVAKNEFAFPGLFFRIKIIMNSRSANDGRGLFLLQLRISHSVFRLIYFYSNFFSFHFTCILKRVSGIMQISTILIKHRVDATFACCISHEFFVIL